jgi:hypothetical protein
VATNILNVAASVVKEKMDLKNKTDELLQLEFEAWNTATLLFICMICKF